MSGNSYADDPTGFTNEDTSPQIDNLLFNPALVTPVVPGHESIPISEGDLRPIVIRQEEEQARRIKFLIGKLNDFLQWFILVLQVTLFVRFFFKLIGADPTNVFAGFLYALTDVILYPFISIIHNPTFSPTRAFEFTTLIGMGIYALIVFAFRRFLHILISAPEEPAV